MTDLPWYADGLQVQVLSCGACCTERSPVCVGNKEKLPPRRAPGRGRRGNEIRAGIVRRLAFARAAEFPGECVFFDGANKQMARLRRPPAAMPHWPFWASKLCLARGWERTCEVCPRQRQRASSISLKRSQGAATRRARVWVGSAHQHDVGKTILRFPSHDFPIIVQV